VNGDPQVLRAPPAEAIGNPADGWEVYSLDTRRFHPMYWRGVSVLSVPPAVSRGELFKHAMKLLESAAVPYSLLLSRYEKVTTGRAMVVYVPLEAIRLLVESQALQDELELSTMEGEITADKLFTNPAVKDEAHRLRAEWKRLRYDMDLLRSLTMALFKVRGDHHPPAILVYSAEDDDFLTIVCRDILLTADGYHRELPVLRPKEWLTWPLRDHNSTDDKELPLKARGKERLSFEVGMEVATENKTVGS